MQVHLGHGGLGLTHVHVLFPWLRAYLMLNLLLSMVKILSLGRCQSTCFGRRGRAGQSIDRSASYASQHTLQTAPVATQLYMAICQCGKIPAKSISGLVVEYLVAIDVTRARFPADALFAP